MAGRAGGDRGIHRVDGGADAEDPARHAVVGRGGAGQHRLVRLGPLVCGSAAALGDRPLIVVSLYLNNPGPVPQDSGV
jgi:hypothetical protein